MIFTKFKNSKWFRKIILALLVLFFLLFVPALIINLYFSPVLSQQLKKTVDRMGNGLYHIDFSSSSLYVLSGRIVVNHLTLKPDNAVFNALKKAGKAPNTVYYLSVDRIVLKHVHPFKLYFDRELDVDDIEINQPAVKVFYHPLLNHDLPDSSAKKTVYQQISGTLKLLHIGQISLDNINLRYQENIDGKIRIIHRKDIRLKGTDLLIDSVSQNDKNRFNFFKDITAIFSNYNGETADQRYKYQAESITFSSSQSRIKAVNAVFMPQKLVSITSEKKIAPQGQLSFNTDSITVRDFDYRSFIRNRRFAASVITVSGGEAKLFYDRHLQNTLDSTVKVKHSLKSLISSIRKNIVIKTVRFNAINLAYSEISPRTKLPGTITFEQLNGTVNNIITGTDTSEKNRLLTADFTASLMGYGKMNLNVRYNPADLVPVTFYKGSLGVMNLVNLNPATKPLGLIQFTNGIITSLTFDMRADDKNAKGKVTFLYHDLNVVLLRKNENGGLKRMPFVSFLANALVLLRNNPTFNNPPRIIDVAYRLPENMSYLGTLWRSVYSGIKESIGLSAEIEQKLRKRVMDYRDNKEQRSINKADRQEKRNQRRIKRQLKAAQNY